MRHISAIYMVKIYFRARILVKKATSGQTVSIFLKWEKWQKNRIIGRIVTLYNF